MMAASGNEAGVLRQIEHLTALADLFNDVLHREQATLRTRNVDAINSVTARKVDLLREIESASAALTGALRAAGHTPDRGGLIQSLSTPELRAAWQNMRRKTRDCMRLNRANGALIEISRSFNGALITLLRGEEAGGSVYDRAGRVPGRTAPRSIASA